MKLCTIFIFGFFVLSCSETDSTDTLLRDIGVDESTDTKSSKDTFEEKDIRNRSDVGTLTDTSDTSVDVSINNAPPKIVSSPTIVGTHDSEYVYMVRFTDPDSEDTLTISAQNLPAWLSLTQDSNSTAVLSGIPNASAVGELKDLVLAVSDAVNSVEQQFSIYISASVADEKLEALSLNRQAITLSASERNRFPKAQSGFQWNDGDDRTDKWRPQGIAEINTPNKIFAAVSWYGREGHEDRGARISFADVSDPNNVRYRHAILLDADLNPLSGVHAGGIVHKNGNLYVPDSRASHRIHVFPIASLTKVASGDLANFYNYGYYLQTDDSFTTVVKPSFMSFDWSRNEFLFGSFEYAGAGPGTLEWTSAEMTTSNQFYEIMQGAASNNNRLWIATSYGRGNNSKLYYGNYVIGDTPDLSTFKSDVHPPGLEDLDISATSNRIWFLTEFGPHEGASTNHRNVFYADRDQYFP